MEMEYMTQAEKLCLGVNPTIKKQALTLANAVIAMQEKLDQQIPRLKDMELYQEVKVGTGETVLRQNPAIAEFRALVRDYTQTLCKLKDLIDGPIELQKYEKNSKLHVIGNSKWAKKA